MRQTGVSMPARLIAAVKERVGTSGFEAYVRGGVERRMQREALDEVILANTREHGAVPQAMQDRATGAIRAARARAAAEDGAARPDGRPSREVLLLDTCWLHKTYAQTRNSPPSCRPRWARTCWSR